LVHRGEPDIIGVEGDARHAGGVFAQDAPLTGGQVPGAHAAVLAATDQQALAREGDGTDVLLMAAKGVQHLSSFQVADDDGAILAAGSDHVALWSEGDRIHVPDMPAEDMLLRMSDAMDVATLPALMVLQATIEATAGGEDVVRLAFAVGQRYAAGIT